MKKIIILCLYLVTLPMACSTCFADQVYRGNGKLIDPIADIEIWPHQFVNKSDAQEVASKLENGQVFQDQDTKLYQVFYGNVEITGLVVLSSYGEN